MNRGNVLFSLRRHAVAKAPTCINGHWRELPRKPGTRCQQCAREWRASHYVRRPRKSREIQGAKTAVMQALFIELRVPLTEIARLMQVKYTTVYTSVWRSRKRHGTVLPWNMRRHQQEAIAKARELLGGQS